MPTPTALPASFTSGDVLTAANMNLLRGGFRILQVFVSKLDTSQSTTSGTFTDITGSSVTVTPQAASNKILIISANPFLASGGGVDPTIQIMRNATILYTEIPCILDVNNAVNTSLIHLDSPNSTSALTYKLQFNRQGGAGTVFHATAGTAGAIIVAEVSA